MTYQLNKINKIIINEDFAIVDLDETIVLMNEKSGEFLRLNETGALIFNYILNTDSFDINQLNKQILQMYNIIEDEIINEINKFLNSLESLSIIKIKY